MPFIEYFLKKKPHELSADDISRFVDERIEENRNLDYRSISLIRDFYKVAKHVSAFANSEGGLIMLGVGEEKQMGGNKMQRIFPAEITWSNHGISREQLEDNLNRQIEPPAPLKIVPIRKSATHVKHIEFSVE